MTEESKEDLVKRAETALSGLALREPNWDEFASRIAGAFGAAPPEDGALFEAPLPVTDDDRVDAVPTTAPADDSVPASTARQEAVTATTVSDDAGPTLSIAPASSDDLDDGWSDAPDASADELAGAEDLTAHAAREDSAPLAAAEAPESRREGVSLADLARASVARRGSEAASIAKESLAVASQSRAQDAEVLQRMQAAAALPQAATSVAPPAPSARGGDVLRGPWVGVVIAGIGLAAGFGLYMRGQKDNQTPVAIVEPAKEQPAPRAEPALPQAPVAKPETPPVLEPAPAREAALDPSSLPTEPRERAPHGEPKAAGAAAKSPAPAAGASRVLAEKVVLEEDQKGAAKTAPSPARSGDAKLRPAELSSDTMTDRPSAGAAQAAVGAVLGAARACIAGHPQPSSAQLLFASDGTVQSVTVGGPATNTAAAGCIESALKKARVQPFAASSFSLGVTVRPP